ncbi:hypothetical protein [Streptomyces sp. NBC_01353]|uniref:hypothetical protein n=1 Tax=Streptomyces sp. NBC_01353 TaxID=2903835 RepID=UPI002E2F67CF|nr:hypothetical protein [Streptomyces sp. NBC_01353]
MEVAELRESFPEVSRPGPYEALDVVIERYRELGLRPGPTEPLDPAALAGQAAKLLGVSHPDEQAPR